MKSLFTSLSFLLIMTAVGFCSALDTFRDHSIARANISRYIADHQWLVCIDHSNKVDGTNDTVIFQSDGKIRLDKIKVWGMNKLGNVFSITGDLHPGSTDLLSIDSYSSASIMFSTVEGCVYIWNVNEGKGLFEHGLSFKEYDAMIQRFKLYPFYESVNGGLLSFRLLKENPNFYDQAAALPRPKSMYHLDDPEARPVRTGMLLGKQQNIPVVIVKNVIDRSPASEAGIREGDRIVEVRVNGVNLSPMNILAMEDAYHVKILTLKIERKLNNDEFSRFTANVFMPSPLEAHLIPPR